MIRMLLLAALLCPAGAYAQVSVDRGALTRLQPSAPAAHKPPARQATRAPAHRAAGPATTPSRSAPTPTSSRATKLRPGVPPAVPTAPPSAAVLPPPVVAPPRPVPPPPPVPVIATAAGEVSQIKGGVRLTFGPGVSDLNPATEQAIRGFADTVKDNPNADLNIYAFAAGVPDDPSTPRRLSLARALAVRAILISQGIVSTRIYPRALGAGASPLGGDGPLDRVDLVLATVSAATP